MQIDRRERGFCLNFFVYNRIKFIIVFNAAPRGCGGHNVCETMGMPYLCSRMTKRVDPRWSEVVNAMRFPLVVLVVFSHCVLIRENSPAQLSLSGDNVFLMVELLFRSFGSVAVPWFALISGYFFISKHQMTLRDYGTSVSRRVRTLLIPYVLWNLLFIVAVWSKNTIASYVGFALGVQPIEVAQLKNNSLLELLLLPIDHPLWYVRELMYLTLLSPLVYLSVRYLRWGSVVLWCALYLFGSRLGVFVTLRTPIAFYFALGMYLRHSAVDVLALCHRLRYIGFVGAVVYVVFFVFYNDHQLGPYIRAAVIMGLIIALFNLFAWLRDRQSAFIGLALRLSSATFFVYALHAMLIINLVRGVLYLTPLGENGWGHTAIFFLTGILTTLISLGVYRLASAYLPKTTAILCGGRA